MGIGDFERVELLFGPSPVHRLERLTVELGGAEIWAKREDCNAGLAYGGNKTRKLEYLVADALASGCDTLVSIGGVQSNHTRQVAATAARLGLKCVLVQESWVDWPDVTYDRTGNILLSRLLGADVRLVRSEFGIGFKESWELALREVELTGGTPYPIPAGASDHPLGGLGFARWADEVATQEQQLGVFFDTVVVCSVTGSTQAGMIAGFAGQHRPRRVIGIDGVRGEVDGRADRPGPYRRDPARRHRPLRPPRRPARPPRLRIPLQVTGGFPHSVPGSRAVDRSTTHNTVREPTDQGRGAVVRVPLRRRDRPRGLAFCRDGGRRGSGVSW